ncbi:hypothetical protein [Sphingomonas sp.]|uniref:TRAFAC clade GTPase domain-containing protein n=1 Tax=Sphingomonas sp. TaxID=28214 RepID=UPI0028A6D24C|nr:hypothetical protein [Sphingomonas sp.]
MTVRRILVAGIPASGKSTYIAAMRHVLISDETDSALIMGKMAADERHLNALQDRWLALETFVRTRENSEAWATVHVRTRATGDEAELIIPDLRGELFERPAATGKCLRSVADALGDADGILLFTNAEKPHDEHLISDYGDADEEALVGDRNPEQSVTGPQSYFEASEAPDEAEPEREVRGPDGTKRRLRFRPDRMPEEAMIVELLQFANRRPRLRRPRRLAVIVSAWDAVIEGEDERTPEQWFAQERPMLSQFLRYNADAWEIRFYGASAQGGRLPRDAPRLAALENASERVIMIGPDVPRHDPTSPIAWLIDGG